MNFDFPIPHSMDLCGYVSAKVNRIVSGQFLLSVTPPDAFSTISQQVSNIPMADPRRCLKSLKLCKFYRTLGNDSYYHFEGWHENLMFDLTSAVKKLNWEVEQRVLLIPASWSSAIYEHGGYMRKFGPKSFCYVTEEGWYRCLIHENIRISELSLGSLPGFKEKLICSLSKISSSVISTPVYHNSAEVDEITSHLNSYEFELLSWLNLDSNDENEDVDPDDEDDDDDSISS